MRSQRGTPTNHGGSGGISGTPRGHVRTSPEISSLSRKSPTSSPAVVVGGGGGAGGASSGAAVATPGLSMDSRALSMEPFILGTQAPDSVPEASHGSFTLGVQQMVPTISGELFAVVRGRSLEDKITECSSINSYSKITKA